MSELFLYRIVKRKWSAQAFDGQGSRLYGGRWNSKGRSCVYMAGSPSLAVLEVLVHISRTELILAYDMFKVKVDSKLVLRASLDQLPVNWMDEPAPQEDAQFGDSWLESRKSLVLSVPSALVPEDWNYLINCDHPDFDQVVNTAELIQFSFDPRLK